MKPPRRLSPQDQRTAMTPWTEEESVRVSFTANCFVRATRCRKLMPKWR